MLFFFERGQAENLMSNIENMGSADEDLIDDPAALEAAQEAANAVDPDEIYEVVDATWVPVLGPTGLQGLSDASGLTTGAITMPLAAEGIPFAWDPFPPEERTGPYTRPFTLLVPPGDSKRARELLGAYADTPPMRAGGPAPLGRPTPPPNSSAYDPAADSRRQIIAWSLVLLFAILFGIAYLSGYLTRLFGRF